MNKLFVYGMVSMLAVLPGMSGDIAEDEVPSVVSSSLKSAYANTGPIDWNYKRVKRYKRFKQTYYASFQMEGHQYDIQLTPRGKIIYVCHDIDFSDLPLVVQKTLVKRYPQKQIQKILKITEGSNVRYQIQTVNGQGTCKLTVSVNGKMVCIDD